ncbi:MAG: cbb3-type cytochrome c oxidase subunit I, partial [Calditrichaeota bacterium]|nr:cbb3-type cytochrome c oxidase subunit I [Calditrichota bacterium]
SLVGGFLAGVIRTQLLTPEADVVSQEFFNSATTIHATIMIFFVVIPAFSGFGN